MKIVVLSGGTSTERDVSISTSVNVCKALRKLGHSANVIDVFYGTNKYAYATEFFKDENNLDELKTKLEEKSKEVKNEIRKRKRENGEFFGENVLEFCKEADIVFMGLHGENGENGKIQATFDLMGIKYTGTNFKSSLISMDKDLTKKVLIPNGLAFPKGNSFIKGENIDLDDFKEPLVVKPACGGSSIGVFICKTRQETLNAIKEAFNLEDKILIEEFVKGREFSVGVIGGTAYPVVEIIPRDGVYDYKNKYDPNGAKEICPANITEEQKNKMQENAIKACKYVGINTYARIDQLMDENGNIKILEINTLPGMTKTSLLPKEANAQGLSYEELVEKLIEVSINTCNIDGF